MGKAGGQYPAFGSPYRSDNGIRAGSSPYRFDVRRCRLGIWRDAPLQCKADRRAFAGCKENVEKRLTSIEEKLDILLTQKPAVKETISKTTTSKINNIDKKFEEMETVLARISERLMKE